MEFILRDWKEKDIADVARYANNEKIARNLRDALLKESGAGVWQEEAGMRTESEMLELITKTAREDPRIRAAYLEGSRANPNVPADLFQDYDVVYIVTETGSFRKDRKWIDRFGERLYMQYPEESAYFPSDVENGYGWLIQFRDGNRLDLHVCTRKKALDSLGLYRTLVDKDGCMPAERMTSEERYWVTRPSKELCGTLKLPYDEMEERGSREFLERVRTLPRNAKGTD